MKNLNPLYEFSPGDILTSVRGVVPHIKSATDSAKGSLKNIKNVVRRHGKKSLLPAIGRETEKVIVNDPTLFGTGVRNLERVRQIGGFKTLQNLPPLPTPDTQSVSQIKDTFTKNGLKRMGKTARKAISRPIKTMDDFITNRATLGTFTDSPMMLFPGIGAYENPLHIATRMNGIDAISARNVIRDTKNYYMGAIKNLRK